MTPYAHAHQWLRDNLERWLKPLFPGGKLDGHNFVASDIDGGGGGRSFSICLQPEGKRGLYKDFATGEKPSWDRHLLAGQDTSASKKQDFCDARAKS